MLVWNFSNFTGLDLQRGSLICLPVDDISCLGFPAIWKLQAQKHLSLQMWIVWHVIQKLTHLLSLCLGYHVMTFPSQSIDWEPQTYPNSRGCGTCLFLRERNAKVMYTVAGWGGYSIGQIVTIFGKYICRTGLFSKIEFVKSLNQSTV